MIQRVSAGELEGALSYFSIDSVDTNRKFFYNIRGSQLIPAMTQIGTILPISIENGEAQYFFQQQVGGINIAFPIRFRWENGTWKILEF